MRFSILLSLLPLAISVGAINVTEPAKGDEIDVSNTFAVKWTSVNTDASTVDIVLINNNVYPNIKEKIASGVDTSEGSYTVKGLKGVTDGSGFQINLLSTEEQNTGILAQSQKFDVTKPEDDASTTTTGTSSTISSSSASTSASTSTGSSTTETDASTTGTCTPGVSTIKPSTGNFTSGPFTTTTGTTSTGTTTGTNTKTGLTTSATGTSTGTATGSASASPTVSEGAAMALVAPGAAAGLLAGVLAFL
ncbi:Cell wall beta-glucan synthesis [Penicillium robsamsonii]|uniref:Cell wall beta-glucan synthesis n=1 Tax=Penicillium robsamsonii TaxID=1792511 RepID=UPI002546CE44|nr:Cell wall beta-glucan synthesis [Penicillium robsamsonii]KAJ5827456.1 Cell wall beta-glucan synthesis [Penicillium robsamsonii]